MESPNTTYPRGLLAQHGVGVYLTGKNGRRDPDVRKRIAQYTDAIAEELGVGREVSGSHTFLQIDANDRSNWDRMAQWLEDQRATYERVLLKSPDSG